jgi:hypothetical protein
MCIYIFIYDLGDRRGYSHLKEEALDRIKWRNRFGRGCGPVVCLTDCWWMITGCGPVVWQITDDDDWLWTCRLTDYWWMMTGCGPVAWQITDDDDWLWTCRLTDYWWCWLAVDLSSDRLLMNELYFTLCIEFHAASRQTKACRSWPHRTEGWARLYYDYTIIQSRQVLH